MTKEKFIYLATEMVVAIRKESKKERPLSDGKMGEILALAIMDDILLQIDLKSVIEIASCINGYEWKEKQK